MREYEKPSDDMISLRTLSYYEEEANSIDISFLKDSEIIKKTKSTKKAEELREQKIKAVQKKTNDIINSTVKNRNGSSFIKSLVSKKKNRFCFDGFDLDLSYITPRVIAMGIPCTSYEAFYRNDMNEVLNFFNTRHPQHYKVYNLCSEKVYDNNIFYKQGYYPFPDREAPPLNMLRPFCEDAKKFLDEDPKNVVAIHCLAGKGRTGTFISCLLLYLGEFDFAFDCLRYYGIMRVGNGIGVNEPSQIRYVFYFEKILKNKIPNPIVYKKLRIKKIRMWTTPAVSKITFTIENKPDDKNNNVFDYNKKEYLGKNSGCTDFEVGDEGFIVCGDVRVVFYTFSLFGSKEKVFKFWFNTNFVPKDDVLEIRKDLIDIAWKDAKCKTFNPNFKIEVHMIDVDI